MKRSFQKAIPPVEFPPALRAALARPRWSMADQFAREEIFATYRPKIALALAQDHAAVAGATPAVRYEPHEKLLGHGRWVDSWRDAEKHTRAQHAELGRAHLSRAFDEDAIRDYADNYARICSKMLTHEHRAEFAKSLGVTPPAGRTITSAGASARMDDAQWWRRQLRRAWTRRAENVMREIGIVRKGREPYASDDAVTARALMKDKGRKFLENHEAVNEAGEQLSLFKLAEHSLANPALRRGEFMCRVRGFEEIAKDAGHVAQFWTLTTPSKFHAQLSTGKRNEKFGRLHVRDAQGWLCKQWARARAKLKRLSILLYGFRIAEPHHDATPHWHLLLFVRPRDAATVERVICGYWLAEDGDERGAREFRAKCIEIDPTQGSATGYVAKYVSKNIDGAGTIGEAADEETGRAVGDGVRRVDAWASLHGIRQFQQVGGPPVGLWRELRRITEAVEDVDIERARARADVGDWRGFIYSISGDGIGAGRRTSVRIAREETGELTKYSEEKPAPVIGVACSSVVEITRKHLWRIQRCGTQLPDGGISHWSESSDAPVSERLRLSGLGSCGLPAGPRRGLVGLRLGEHGKPKRRRRSADDAAASSGQHSAPMPQRASAGIDQGSLIFSDLGPVAITVRERICGLCGELAVRGRHRCDPSKRPRREPRGPSVAAAEIKIPFFDWEKRLRAFEREHGRLPDIPETQKLYVT